MDLLSSMLVGVLSLSSNLASPETKSGISIEEKCAYYTSLVRDYDYTKYDSIRFNYEDGPTFLDTELENVTAERYKPICDEWDSEPMYNDGDGHSTNGIYGCDDRYEVPSASHLNWPYSAVCTVKTKYSNTGYFYGTGAMVGPNVFLTASHCVYNSTYGWPTELKVYPGYYNDTPSSYGYASMTDATIGVYFNTGDSNDDWAIIGLDSNIGNQVGYFGVEAASLYANDTIRNIAYQGDKYGLTDTLGGAYIIETFKFYHRVDAVSGSSGSPIFKQNSMNICGIHSAGIHQTDFDYNIACRITTYLESWVSSAINDWAIDD